MDPYRTSFAPDIVFTSTSFILLLKQFFFVIYHYPPNVLIRHLIYLLMDRKTKRAYSEHGVLLQKVKRPSEVNDDALMLSSILRMATLLFS